MKIKNNKYKQQEQRYKYEVEKDGKYEYIRSYRRGDILPNSKIVGDSPYIQIKHKYCGSVYVVQSGQFISNNKRCGNCCGSYENSLAYHIEKVLGEPLDKYWDFEKNVVDPYLISKNFSKFKVYIKCTENNYHGSYETTCKHFVSGKRCGYCAKRKIHPLDSFGYHNFDKVMSWHPDNKISHFKVAPGSIKKHKFICHECGYEWSTQIRVVSNGGWCPQCNLSKGEKEISKWLRLNNIEFIPQKTYENLLGLGGGNLSYDFYLPNYNLLIEYQGEQHEKYTLVFHTSKEDFNKQQEHDKRKKDYAKENEIELLEIWYWDFDNIEEILNKQINNIYLRGGDKDE